MNFFYEWLRQIVVLVFIGTLLEVLMPTNRLKKYVHLVFGLLFLLLLTQPIFYLFKQDVTSYITEVEGLLTEDERKLAETKRKLEEQKEDIQAEQVAYIWNELGEEYKALANPILGEKFNLEVKDIDFRELDELRREVKDLLVIVGPSEEEIVEEILPIKQIQIQSSNTEDNEGREVEDAVEATLRKVWQLEETTRLNLSWRGGTIN